MAFPQVPKEILLILSNNNRMKNLGARDSADGSAMRLASGAGHVSGGLALPVRRLIQGGRANLPVSRTGEAIVHVTGSEVLRLNPEP